MLDARTHQFSAFGPVSCLYFFNWKFTKKPYDSQHSVETGPQSERKLTTISLGHITRASPARGHCLKLPCRNHGHPATVFCGRPSIMKNAFGSNGECTTISTADGRCRWSFVSLENGKSENIGCAVRRRWEIVSKFISNCYYFVLI